MTWLELSLRTDARALDAVSNFLIERGSPGVVIKKDQVQAYFACPPNSSSIQKDVHLFIDSIRGVYPTISARGLRWRVLKERNWNTAWRRFSRPQRIGTKFWVTPPWTKPPSFRHRRVIVIEPGMAFGTGSHPTTRGCMEFMERIASLLDFTKIAALDVGTGSGILAIALAKLGVEQIIALDSDPVALKVARENVRRNGVRDQVVVTGARLGEIRRPFHVVVANLTAETILQLALPLAKRVRPSGYLILSGILKPRDHDVLRHFGSAGFQLIARKPDKEWVTLLLRQT